MHGLNMYLFLVETAEETSESSNERTTLPKPRAMPVFRVTTSCETARGRVTKAGLLYKYTSIHEVRIACLCHGASFSPEGFIAHAGWRDTSNVLRKIIVNHAP